MLKKVRVLVAVLLAVVLLVVGGSATVMAQEEGPAPAPEVNTRAFMATANATGLLPRVAGILGISQEELTNAFKQAQQELRAEALIRRLDKAVAEGRITQEEADAIKEWWEQKPEALLGPGLLPSAFGKHMRGGPGGWASDNTTSLPRAFGKHMRGGPGGWGWVRPHQPAD